jgi:hypothetical protein
MTDPRVPIPWDEIRTEWQAGECVAARKALDKLEVGDVDRLLFATAAPNPKDARHTLERAFRKASSHPDGKLLLALYLYGRCLEKWEQTEDYNRIRTVLGAFADAVQKNGTSADARARLLSIIVRQAQLMDEQIGVEEAMNCSCPVAMEKRALVVVDGLEVLLEKEQTLGDGLVDVREIVRADAATTRQYYETIVEVARAVLAFVEQDAPGAADFEGVLDVLRRAERAVAAEDDVYESELRAHRASLEALRDRAEEPRLRIDAAKVVYLYPFTLEGLDAEETVTRALGDEVVEALVGAGFSSANVAELDLNDLWDRSDVSRQGYSGASIELPRITVETTADERLEFRADVRLSRLGNHHLRIWAQLDDAGLHEVNQALRRGSRAMGAEIVTSASRVEQWEKLPEYAEDVIETIANALGAEPVGDLNSTFHVVLAARSISVQQRDGSTSPAKKAELEQAVGATLLFHPVRYLATSLEEWIRYPAPTVTNLLEGQGYASELVVRTDNTTVTFMPGSPEWRTVEYEEMIEFVTSIPPLLTLWDRSAERLARKLDSELREVEERMKRGVDPIEKLYEQEMEIRRVESDIRRQLAFLHSPALCRTRGQREFIDALWEAASLPALESELEVRLKVLAERQERVASMTSLIDARNRREQRERAERVERDQRERAERLERPIQVVLGLLGVASLVSVFDWINNAAGVGGRWWTWGETAILFGAAVFVFVMYRRTMSADRGA